MSEQLPKTLSGVALPSCKQCGNLMFRMRDIESSDSNFKLKAVTCSACSEVLELLDFHNIGQLIDASTQL
jgi:hypothetical protein